MAIENEFDKYGVFSPDDDSADNAPLPKPELTVEEEAAHHLPNFEDADPSQPILYLPPLLSSLPPSYAHDDSHAHAHAPPPHTHTDDEKEGPLHTETHLPSIDPVSLSLHRALHKFTPVDSKYTSTPYSKAFNWKDLVLPLEEEREWYCVAFRSKRRPGSDSGPLYEQDRLAHEEAVQNGGLLMYWYGVPDPKTGFNLATCIWQSRQHAINASSGPQHILAMKLAASSFQEYRLERYVLRKLKGRQDVVVEEYKSGPVGW